MLHCFHPTYIAKSQHVLNPRTKPKSRAKVERRRLPVRSGLSKAEILARLIEARGAAWALYQVKQTRRTETVFLEAASRVAEYLDQMGLESVHDAA